MLVGIQNFSLISVWSFNDGVFLSLGWPACARRRIYHLNRYGDTNPLQVYKTEPLNQRSPTLYADALPCELTRLPGILNCTDRNEQGV